MYISDVQERWEPSAVCDCRASSVVCGCRVSSVVCSCRTSSVVCSCRTSSLVCDCRASSVVTPYSACEPLNTNLLQPLSATARISAIVFSTLSCCSCASMRPPRAAPSHARCMQTSISGSASHVCKLSGSLTSQPAASAAMSAHEASFDISAAQPVYALSRCRSVCVRVRPLPRSSLRSISTVCSLSGSSDLRGDASRTRP